MFKKNYFEKVDTYNNPYFYSSTYVEPCKVRGFYHTVRFLFFKRRFIACELCGEKHKDTGWKIFL